MEFKKATLQEVSSQPSPTPKTVGDAIEMQINPASLRLAMANNVDAGKAFARPNTQYQGSSSSTLSFDLVFDTADEGTTEVPVDVRSRTRQLERFLLPSTATPKAVPPRVQFTYGTLTVIGVMSALNQEFDFFAPNGVPLRAKSAVTIKEQKPEFDAKQTGPGANTGAGATPPLPPSAGGGPGSGPPGPAPDRTGTALDGESASDFASRMGLDPAAWKGLADALSDPLRLEAGLEIDFSASLSLDIGLGVELGATAGLGSLTGARPEPGADVAATPRPPSPVPATVPADGSALTASGGLSRAMAKATTEHVRAASDKSKASFAPEDGVAPSAPMLRRSVVPAAAPASVASGRFRHACRRRRGRPSRRLLWLRCSAPAPPRRDPCSHHRARPRATPSGRAFGRARRSGHRRFDGAELGGPRSTQLLRRVRRVAGDHPWFDGRKRLRVRVRGWVMTLHVGSVSSQVEVQAQAGTAGGAAGGGGPSTQPSWDERQRHRRLVEAERRERARVAGRGFDD